MEISLIKKYVRNQVRSMLKEADKPTVKKATMSDTAKLSYVFNQLAKRSGSASAKRKIISQVIQSLAGALEVTPSEVLKSYLDYKRDAKQAKKQEK